MASIEALVKTSDGVRAESADMVWIAGGTFRMGSERHYPEEAPVHRVTVDGFFIDRMPVTNRDFRKFVNATGHVTLAEIKPKAEDYPGALPHMLKAGSMVFTLPKHPVDLKDWSQWWRFKFGSDWRRPYGPRSSISGLDDHPVVHIAYCDAETYAKWAGKELPTEAEWEHAARAGTTTSRFFGDSDSLLGEYAWYSRNPPKRKGDPVDPNDPQRTSPVGRLKPNPLGLFDVYGNVWEWTQSRVLPYPASGVHVDVEDDVLVVSDSTARVRRGGGFPYEAAMMRSAARGTVTAFPFLRRDNVGFRVARTIR